MQLNAAMSCILPLYALTRPFIYTGRLRIFSRTACISSNISWG